MGINDWPKGTIRRGITGALAGAAGLFGIGAMASSGQEELLTDLKGEVPKFERGAPKPPNMPPVKLDEKVS